MRINPVHTPTFNPDGLCVLHQDAHCVAIDKPAGLLVHRTGWDFGETRFALQLLRDQLGLHLWPLHRLDKGTSGVLVFALSEEAARVYGAVFASGEVSKTYSAVVRGWLADAGSIDHPLAPPDAGGHAPHSVADQEHADATHRAVTHWQTQARLLLPIADRSHEQLRASVLTLKPEQGRWHQLRRHLKHAAHPIMGDATHGKGPLNRTVAALVGQQRLWLHADALRLPKTDFSSEILIKTRQCPISTVFSSYIVDSEYKPSST